MSQCELAGVIPVFNEEKIIGKVINDWEEELQKNHIDFKIHIYNASSTDNTSKILNELSKRNQKIVIHQRPRTGHGPDLVQGYKDNCDAEWIFQVDSDNEMGTEAFKDLWQRRNNYQFLLGGRKRYNQSLPRKTTSFFSRAIVRFFYGTKVFDVNSPYRLMNTKYFKGLFLNLSEYMSAPNLVVSGYASLRNMTVYEQSVDCNERKDGTADLKKWKLFQTALKCFIETIAFRFKV